MGAQSLVRKALRRGGVHAWRTPPRGADLFADIRRDLSQVEIKVIYDVGANVGQSTLRYADEFPYARIHAFEPVPATFQELSNAVGSNMQVRVYQLAFGAEPGEAMMDPTDDSSTALISDTGTIPVKVDTLDRFCSDHINFLKIDAEGYDLEVLKGATKLLSERKIDICQVEVGMSPRHHMHVRFEDVKAFMEANGMELFSIIDQTLNYIPGGPYMQRADAVFISDRLTNH